jgi:cob(I)alamin adenosyltransferase
MARLTHITTRSGDSGQTGLADGSRVDKDSLRIQALGDLDELNAALGLLTASGCTSDHQAMITGIQQRLFDLGGELALPGTAVISREQILELEQAMNALNNGLPALKEFVLPGGNHAAALCHLARAICRRAERSLWRLSRKESVNSESPKYLNRLSDLLFVLARILARQSDSHEPVWNRET